MKYIIFGMQDVRQR